MLLSRHCWSSASNSVQPLQNLFIRLILRGMRPLEDIKRRWTSLDSAIGVDLRQAVRDGDGVDPCENGLRSVCWKAFLLYGPLSQTTWPKKLAESRSAYVSLRDHFLRFIDHPNHLHSTADPLADDDTSPWSTLRQDESSREEIFQDVTRCMQDNYFFREPATQKKLLDILFIYSKLNPDTGYRQGMHELLAPIIWVVQQDAIDDSSIIPADRRKEGAEFMLDVLDRKYIEHDAFSMFCAMMQTAKAFYEMGDNSDSSPIVARSQRIHNDLLAAVDPELALHLQVVGILPQIYSIRWIRLLFGREFDFKDVLRLWDFLFAEDLRSDIIDMTCVAMLLRIRWSLVEADYTVAITALTHFSLPDTSEEPRSLVRDALYLERNRTPEDGATLVQRYSGRRPKIAINEAPEVRLRADRTPVRGPRATQHRASASPSPARFTSPQKQLEGLFQEVSGGIQRRTEGWNVSKAVRGAVGEVRRNVNNFQTHSRPSSVDIPTAGNDTPVRHNEILRESEIKRLRDRLRQLNDRNKALARMLDNSLDSLRSSKSSDPDGAKVAEETFNVSLAKIQFVSVYLADSDIPIPPEDVRPVEFAENRKSDVEKSNTDEEETPSELQTAMNSQEPGKSQEVPNKSERLAASTPETSVRSPGPLKEKSSPPGRPSLADSSFSFMLGEGQHRSGFVSSVADLPEQRRGSDSKARPKQLWAEEKERKEKKDKKDKKERKERQGSEIADDGFTMSSLHGGHGV